ncbi:hypothetical protein KIPB_014392, partial [Kipferlia bialata]
GDRAVISHTRPAGHDLVPGGPVRRKKLKKESSKSRLSRPKREGSRKELTTHRGLRK